MSEPPSIPTLGDLEIAVLDRVWSHPGISVKEMHECVGVARGISLNTVQSALDRLFRKGLLTRVKDGHAFRYTALVARDQLVGALIGDMLGRFGADASSALATLMETADRIDEATLDMLERELERRRGRTGRS